MALLESCAKAPDAGRRGQAMALPTVLQHLQALDHSRVIRSEKTGRVRTCRLEPAALATAEHWSRRSYQMGGVAAGGRRRGTICSKA
jgi:hypothetical protein